MSPTMVGLLLTLLAGALSGNCMLPLKWVRRYRWENVWLIFSLFSLLVFPWALGLSVVHHLPIVYARLPASAYAAPLLFGAGWGVAQILFGISVRRLGMGLGYAIIVGLGAVLGTLVPLFFGRRRLISDRALIEVVVGVGVMALGIAFATWGGKLRERSGMKEMTGNAPTSEYAAAVVLAVLCGLMAPMLNYAFAFGQQLAVQAVAIGNSSLRAAYAVWPIALFGGLIPNVAYSVWQLHKRDSWNLFRKTPSDARWPVLMAASWMGAFALYGMSAVYLGVLGTSAGWALFQVFMIITATFSGVMAGEWKRASRAALLLLALGMASLIGATVLLAVGSR